MGKGGYKIIDLQKKASGSTIKGIYEAIESNLYKPILLENIVISGNEVANQYVEVSISGTDFILKNDTIKVTIDDDDVVTIALNVHTPTSKNSNGLSWFSSLEEGENTITEAQAHEFIEWCKKFENGEYLFYNNINVTTYSLIEDSGFITFVNILYDSEGELNTYSSRQFELIEVDVTYKLTYTIIEI